MDYLKEIESYRCTWKICNDGILLFNQNRSSKNLCLSIKIPFISLSMSTSRMVHTGRSHARRSPAFWTSFFLSFLQDSNIPTREKQRDTTRFLEFSMLKDRRAPFLGEFCSRKVWKIYRYEIYARSCRVRC